METYRVSTHARVSAHLQTFARLIAAGWVGGVGAYSVKYGIFGYNVAKCSEKLPLFIDKIIPCGI